MRYTKLGKKQLVPMVVLALFVPAVSGQNASDSRIIEEIVVTVQKRSESAQDVPISISTFNEDMILTTGVDTINALLPMVPGLTGSNFGLATNAWAIRGISSNDFGLGSEPSVGVFIDGAYIGRTVLATSAYFDVARIEVVKGPQGTLFGRNASSGAISIVTNKPDDDDSLRIGLGGGNEGQRDATVVGNLALTDELAIRFAYSGSRLEGIQEDVAQDEYGFLDRDDYRFLSRWTPTDSFEALLVLNYSDAKTNMGGQYNPALSTVEPGEEFPDKIAKSEKERETAESDGIHLRLAWDISDDLTLTSITDRRSYDYTYRQDADASNNDVLIDAIFGFGTGGVTLGFSSPDTVQRSISQEFRLNGSSANVDWFVGISYFEEDIDGISLLDAVDTVLGLGVLGEDRSTISGKTEAIGVYGDATWSVSDALSITGGARWSRDDRSWCTEGVAGLGFVGPDTVGEVCDDEVWSEVTPRLVVDYGFSNDVMVFASVAKGYKGGGFNTSAADFNEDGIGDSVASFDPETNLAYELGLKSTLLEGSLQFNTSAFFNDYKDLQIQTATLGGNLVSNAGDAETKGVEMELTYKPLAALTLYANYSYLDAKFTSGDFEGNALAYAPENSYSVNANFEQMISVGSLSWFVQYNWLDDFQFNAENDRPQDSYGELNANVRFTPGSESWDVAVSVNNITDEEFAAFRSNIGLGSTLTRGMPRLWRIGANFYF